MTHNTPHTRKIFISSTSKDLEDHRLAARDAVIAAGCLPVMMEYFTPQGKHKPLKACLSKVDECDAVIAIVAHRYGSVPEDQPNGKAKSITWLECEHAQVKGKEVLAFVVSEKCQWPEADKEQYRIAKAVETGHATPELLAEVTRNVKLLQEFKAWLISLGFRAEFSKPDDLKLPIGLALATRAGGVAADTTQYLAWLRENTAWIDIRGLQVGSGKVHRFPIRDLYTTLTTAAPLAALQVKNAPARRKPRQRRGLRAEAKLPSKRL